MKRQEYKQERRGKVILRKTADKKKGSGAVSSNNDGSSSNNDNRRMPAVTKAAGGVTEADLAAALAAVEAIRVRLDQERADADRLIAVRKHEANRGTGVRAPGAVFERAAATLANADMRIDKVDPLLEREKKMISMNQRSVLQLRDLQGVVHKILVVKVPMGRRMRNQQTSTSSLIEYVIDLVAKRPELLEEYLKDVEPLLIAPLGR